MLAALIEIKDHVAGNKPIDLRCIHINHGIRPKAESSGDAEFVRSFCKKHKVPCSIFSVKRGKIAELAKKQGIGISAAARLYRRAAWRRKIRKIKAESPGLPLRVLVAHTADDLLETALMRILRGCGPAGLASMPSSKGKILRPLLSLRRSDVLGYLSEKQIPWREDASNTDTKYLRNRIRHRLIPVLDEQFPHWRKSIDSLAKTQSLTASFIQSEAKRLVPWQQGAEGLYTLADGFFARPEIVREEALFQGINLLKTKAKARRAIIRRFSQGLVKAVDLGALRIFQKKEKIVICPLNEDHEYGFSLLIKEPGLYNIKETSKNSLGLFRSSMTFAVKEIPVGTDCGENDFFALLPLVIKPSLKSENPQGGFSAVDSEGLAALISHKGLIWQREIINGNCCMVTVTGV